MGITILVNFLIMLGLFQYFLKPLSSKMNSQFQSLSIEIKGLVKNSTLNFRLDQLELKIDDTNSLIEKSLGTPFFNLAEDTLAKIEIYSLPLIRGNGVFVKNNSDFLLLFSKHLIFNSENKCRRLLSFAEFADGTPIFIQGEIYISLLSDLAFVKVRSAPGRKHLELARSKPFKGSTLFGVSFNGNFVYHNCHLCEKSSLKDFKKVFLTNCDGIPSSSGFGLMDFSGKLVALYGGSNDYSQSSTSSDFLTLHLNQLWDDVELTCDQGFDKSCIQTFRKVVKMETLNPRSFISSTSELFKFNNERFQRLNSFPDCFN